jgi:hypothetical protein
MKKSYINILMIIIGFCLITSCDSGFDDINKSKTLPSSVNPVYMLNNAIIRASYPTNTLVYDESIVQQMITPNSGVLAGANFNQDNRSVTPQLWQRYYREVIKSIAVVIEDTKEDANRTNLYNMARIWRALSFMILTDTYGDVPYEEAGLGYIEFNVSPKYTAQQAIYTDILKELEEASGALDGTKTIETSDGLYSGDVTKWKHLGYSLLLRAAMRLSKIDPTTAKTYVAKAVAGGLIQSNAENAATRHTALYQSDIGNTLNTSEAANYYLADPFVSYLKSNNDPRLGAIAVRYVGAKSGGEQTVAISSKDPAVQIGMPLGYDNGSIGAVVASKGLASFYDFSQVDRRRMGKNTAPVYYVTYAQTQLLLAEAVVREWATGDAATLYSNAIRAHMQQMGEYDPGSSIAANLIDDYVAAHPLNMADALNEINTQYWVASFLNGPEAFANFRRSGFPLLTPNPYPGKEITGDFIRRLTYPDSEGAVNPTNKQDAISRQGPDNLETRVWWDKL